MLTKQEVQTRIDAIILKERERKYGFMILEKRSPKWWAAYVLTFMWIWQRKFMTHYWTTDGVRIYVPKLNERTRDGRFYIVLRHEMVHVRDYQEMKKRFTAPIGAVLWRLLYLGPQLFALGAIGAIWEPWCFLFLVLLAPWPSPFRTWVEKRGYAETVRAAIDVYGAERVTDKVIDEIVDHNFIGWAYWRMSWRRKPVHDYLTKARGG